MENKTCPIHNPSSATTGTLIPASEPSSTFILKCTCRPDKEEDWEKIDEFEEIVSRMCAEFPIDRVDWNKRVAPYLREFQNLLASQKSSLLIELEKKIEKEIEKFKIKGTGKPNYSPKRPMDAMSYNSGLSDFKFQLLSIIEEIKK